MMLNIIWNGGRGVGRIYLSGLGMQWSWWMWRSHYRLLHVKNTESPPCYHNTVTQGILKQIRQEYQHCTPIEQNFNVPKHKYKLMFWDVCIPPQNVFWRLVCIYKRMQHALSENYKLHIIFNQMFLSENQVLNDIQAIKNNNDIFYIILD